MTTPPAIEITGLTKSYGDSAVLRGVDLSVPAGTIMLVDRVAALIEAAAAQSAGVEEVEPVSDDLVELLDNAFVEAFPCTPRLFTLLEERGWTGWTNIRRKDADAIDPARGPC